ncbi:MAG: two-component regulator propeller domain-containing protein [Bacteroidota bacterium]
MKKLFLSIFILAFSLISFGQGNELNSWTSYLSHTSSVKSVDRNGIVYAITRGGMFSYDLENRESQVFSTIEGLSGINPTTIFYHTEADQVFVGYADGMIDVFREAGQFEYFTDIQRNSFFTQKRINAFAGRSDKLYIATEFGLVIYDLNDGLPETDVAQFADLPSQINVIGVSVLENRVWVLLEDFGLYSAPADFPNLKDPSIWRDESNRDGLNSSLNLLQIESNSSVMMLRTPNSLLIRENGIWIPFDPSNEKVDGFTLSEEAVSVWRITRSSIFGFDGSRRDFFSDGQQVTDVHFVSPGKYITCTNGQGVLGFLDGEKFSLSPTGPATNDCIRVAVGNGEIYIAPKGYNQSFNTDPNRLGIYYFTRDNGWERLSGESGALDPTVSTSFARGIYDYSTGKAVMASWGTGLVELKNGVQETFYNCENAELSVIAPPCDISKLDNSRVSGMDYDLNGNLWVSLDFSQIPLMVKSPEGEWFKANPSRIPNNDHFVDMIVDDFGSKWIINEDQGVLVYNDAQTPLDVSDDWTLTLKSGINQGDLPSNSVTSLVKDQDGFIWVGTTQGVVVFFDPFSISQRQIVDARPPVFDRRPLLGEATINAIAVDGGNRKWLATNDGVFLVSEDGDELIETFTEENSPLLSNVVNDVEVDQTTGEVFFATSLGLISFQGNATAGSRECNDVFVYPNPAFTDTESGITIRGSGAESIVKITTVSGLLVREIQSQGGTAVWDGRDVKGEKVRSGIYLALIADDNGDNACIGKFSVIAR